MGLLTNFCHDHGHDQNAGRVLERGDGKYSAADSGCDFLTEGNGTDELGEGCKDTRLDERQGLRAHRGCVGVGDILETKI